MRCDFDVVTLRGWIDDARDRTLAHLDALDDEMLLGPRLVIVNPPLWEVGHVAWFAERWILREARGRAPIRADVDALYDSMAVAHRTRWDLPLPSRAATRRYLEETRARCLDGLDDADEAERYFHALAVFHEDMHREAFLYTRQTHGLALPASERVPPDGAPETPRVGGDRFDEDVQLEGGAIEIGAVERGRRFCFDNEKWAHEVRVEPFAISRRLVTQGEMAAFVDDGGYARAELWTEAGWAWREETRARHPLYWRKAGDWEHRRFERWLPLDAHAPMVHVNAYEAEAWCRWAGRRLPSEPEWEAACGGAVARAVGGDLAEAADGLGVTFSDVIDHGWQWTSTPFGPYPGFSPDPYVDYSAPWFGDHRVTRGGSMGARRRMLWPSLRNFALPVRRDLFTGFRTCAV